jgi:hypothetical protein
MRLVANCRQKSFAADTEKRREIARAKVDDKISYNKQGRSGGVASSRKACEKYLSPSSSC